MSEQGKLEELANMLGGFHPRMRADIKRMLALEKAGERTQLRSFLGFQESVQQKIRETQSAAQQFIDRTFDTANTLEDIKIGQVAVDEEEAPPASPKVEPNFGMKVFVPAYLCRLDWHTGTAVLRDSRESEEEYEVTTSDVVRTSTVTQDVKVRGVVSGVSEKRVYIELSSPNSNYDRSYPRSVELEEIVETKQHTPAPAPTPVPITNLSENLRSLLNSTMPAAEPVAPTTETTPEIGTVFEYPVHIEQYIPGIGYLVSDDSSVPVGGTRGRSYWLAENGVRNLQDNPTASAKARVVRPTGFIATISCPIDGKRLERHFPLRIFHNAVKQEQISVSDENASSATAESTASISIPVRSTPSVQKSAQVAPEVGMKIEFSVRIQRVIDSYAVLVSDTLGSQEYSIRINDVTLSEDDDTGKIRGTVVRVTDDKIFVELFSPSEQYQRHYPRSLVFEDVTPDEELVPGHLYRTYEEGFGTMLYDGENFIPLKTYPEGKKSRSELPKRLLDWGHIYYN